MRTGRAYELGRPAGPRAPERAPGERYVERDDGESSAGEGRVGARVEHKTFGIGVVQAIDGGSDPIVTVKFSGYTLSGYTPKRIKAQFLKFL
jgi:hypothetical protein